MVCYDMCSPVTIRKGPSATLLAGPILAGPLTILDSNIVSRQDSHELTSDLHREITHSWPAVQNRKEKKKTVTQDSKLGQKKGPRIVALHI